MRKVQCCFMAFLLCSSFIWAGVVAAGSPEVSLNNCQDAIRQEAKKFINNKLSAVGTCLHEVSTQIIKQNNTDASGAAEECVTQFHHLGDSRPGKSLEANLVAGIEKKCDPNVPSVSHTLDDILGSGSPGVMEPMDVQNLNDYCVNFGGDGFIGDLDELIDCVVLASECAADAAIAGQYGRALEWMSEVRVHMQLLQPPPSNPSRISDALAALDMVSAEIDGTPSGDSLPNIQCGVPPPVDADGDTFFTPVDCDDGDDTVNPGASEVCNGKDDDCNGAIDDNLTLSLCPLQSGVCASAQESCGGTLGVLTCGRAEYGLNYELNDEQICDGLDNDCDGEVDEVVGNLCPAQAGVCLGSRQVCGGVGGFQVCSAANYGPNYEEVEISCDGLDNDCDGLTDEGCA